MYRGKQSSHKKANKLILVCFFCCVALTLFSSVNARESYMLRYVDFPQALEEYKYDCGLCHFRPKGGGGRNQFGKAFKKNHKKFDDKLIKLFPKYFKDPLKNVHSVHFSNPAPS